MGGRPKSDLPAPGGGERLIERTVRIARTAALDCVVVGCHPSAAPLPPEVPYVPDDPPGTGPVGGLCGLLRAAGVRPAIAVACDMPFVTAALLTRLAREAPGALVLAPRDPDTAKWQPLFARYDAARVRPLVDRAVADGVRSFQALFARLDITEFALDDDERALLLDWDTPNDMS